MNEPRTEFRIPAEERRYFSELLKHAGVKLPATYWDYRRKTKESTTLGLVLQDNQATTRAYIRCYVDPNRAQEVMAKRAHLKTHGDEFHQGVSLLSDGRSILYRFPNDGSLRQLGQSTDIDKLKRELGKANIFPGQMVRGRKSTIEVLRYKPEHRLLARLSLRLIREDRQKSEVEVFMRVFPDDRAEKIAKLSRHLRQQGLSDTIPIQIGTLFGGTVQLEDFCHGKELFVSEPWPDPKDLADVVLKLGRIEEAPCPPITISSLWAQRQEELRSLRDHVNDRQVAILEATIEQCLGHFNDRYSGVTHGDLHPRQFLIDDKSVILVDLERCALGHPAIDAGHFAAEIELRALEFPSLAARLYAFRDEFLQEWLKRSPDHFAPCVYLASAFSFIAAAARSHRRRLETTSPLATLALLERAQEAIKAVVPKPKSEITWTRLHPSGKTPWAAFGQDEETKRERPGSFDPDTAEFRFVAPHEDKKLPGLVDALECGELLTWRVGRRAVVKIKDGTMTLFRKVLPPKKVAESKRRLDLLEYAFEDTQLITPKVVAVDEERWYLDLTELTGKSLGMQLHQSGPPFAAVAGRIVAALHSLSPLPHLPIRKPDDLETWLRWSILFFPEQARQLEAAFLSLPDPVIGADSIIHGDLHDKNILIEGPKGGLIDLDSVTLGPAARDLGNLMAHFVLRQEQRQLPPQTAQIWEQQFLRSYRIDGPHFSTESVHDEKRRSLFRLSCVYFFRKKWQHVAKRLLDQLTAPLLLFGLILVTGCVSLIPKQEEAVIIDSVSELKARLGVAFLKNKDNVEVQGVFESDRFRAARIEIEEEDDETEIKGELLSWKPDASFLQIGTFSLSVTAKTIFQDHDGNQINRGDLPEYLPSFCKAEAIQRHGRLDLRKLALRHRRKDESDELQGVLESLEFSRERFTIAGTEVKFTKSTPVYWDVAGQPPPSPQDRGLRPRSNPRLKRILRIDDEDLRQGKGIRLADGITLGGEFQWDLEWRRNHNLRKGKARDRLIQEPSTKLEFSFDVSPKFFAFTKFSFRRDWAIFDERVTGQHGSRISISQAYFVALDFPFDGLALEVGRQKFDHGREWVMDDEIDGARIFLNLDLALLEFSVSQRLFDESREVDGVTNFLFAAHMQPFEDSDLFVYALYRNGGRLIDLARFHTGFSFEQKTENITFWADFSYVVGEENNLDVEGYGFDVMLMYVFEDNDWEPSFYVGYAWGSGDDDVSDGKDSSFRQTGLNDNNDRFNGVTGFRYLGELFRPEVSNISILTIGFGFRPYKKTSVDLLYHRYDQVSASKVIRDSRIRLNPLGLDRSLGSEVDLVIGLSAWRPMEIEIVWGYFRPGAAFGSFQDEAWFMTMQIEWNF